MRNIGWRYTLVMLTAVLTACGSAADRQSRPEIAPEPIRISQLGDSSLLFGFINRIVWHDSTIYLWDLKGVQHMQALSYPALEPVVSFCPRGKGPEEMVHIVGFDLEGDELFVLADRYPKVLVYSLSELNRGNGKPKYSIELPEETMPAFGLAVQENERLILAGVNKQDRIAVVDTAGRLVDHQAVVYPVSDEELSVVEEELLPYLWQSKMTYAKGKLVIGTRVAEVLEICDFGDRASSVAVIGNDGIPCIDEEGSLGRVDGFMDVRIVGDKVYAIYSGVTMKEIDRMLDEEGHAPSGGRYFRIYDLHSGELERIYELDRYISTFDVLPDGRTVIAADPNAEHQLYIFVLPEEDI